MDWKIWSDGAYNRHPLPWFLYGALFSLPFNLGHYFPGETFRGVHSIPDVIGFTIVFGVLALLPWFIIRIRDKFASAKTNGPTYHVTKKH